MFDKKSKKSPKKPPQQHISLGIIPSNIAVGPFGFRAEQAVDTESEQSRSHRDLGADGPDSTVMLDKDTRALRIVSQESKNKDQRLVTEVSTPDAVVGGTEQGDDPTKEGTGDAGEGGNEPTEASRDAKGGWTNTALGAGCILLEVAQEAAEAFGPLKAALGAISIIYEKYEETVAVRKKIQDLCSRIAALEMIFRIPTNDVAEKKRRDGLLRKLKGIEGQLQSLSKKPGLQRFADHAQDDEEVSELIENLRETISDYQMVQQMAIYEHIIDEAESKILNNFRRARGAEYRHGDRTGCLKGTRRAVLDEIEIWTKDFDKPHVYWLNGLAGTGKSTIAQTIVERVFADGQLGASFFCSRDYSDRSDLHFIFPTLAVQLARRYTEFRSIFIPLVQSDPDIAYEPLRNQMKKLIVEPLKKSAISTIIVIDALDECKDEEPASAILSVLGRFVSQIPKVKFFLTGRPEPRIQEGFRLYLSAEATDIFVLHNVEQNLVNNDIRLFFKHSFLELACRRHGLDGWPTEEQLDLLCERAAGLFVYAVATIKFIDNKNNPPKEQLDRIMRSPKSSVHEGRTNFKANTTLDSLYTSILQEAFGNDDQEGDTKFRSILGAVILAANPLSPSVITTLLGFSTESVSLRLSSGRSLLVLQDADSPVRPFHKSFPDFIVDPTRCINERFRVSPPSHHMELLVGCLERMNQTLEQNMCDLPDTVTNSEVEDLDERIERWLDPALQYACKSWHKHLVDENTARMPAVTSALHRFLKEKFLFWLEVLSVLGAAREAVDALEVAARWLEASQTLDLVNDYFRFVTGFFEVISTSAPHIYHSALPLSPRESFVRGLYELHARPLIRIVRGLPTLWDPNITTMRFPSFVSAAAWSPCSRSIAISWGKDPPTVEILDAATLVRLTIFEFPKGYLEVGDRLVFSPDGRLLTWFGFTVGGARQGKLISWDLQTGIVVSAISTRDTRPCGSIAYSACGTMFGVLSCSSGGATIRTYNTLSSKRIRSHTVNGRISDKIWAHGESFRFATITLGSITTWEAGFASTHAPTEVWTLSISDGYHNPDIFSVHPTLPRFALVYEGRVHVWDAQDCRSLLDSAHRVEERWMSFSPDGRFLACGGLASGAGSREICLWKESHTGYVLHQKLVSSFGHREPLISPNGGLIITFGGPPVQLWQIMDSTTSLSTASTQALQSDEHDFILGFSPDEALAAVVRMHNETVTVLDLKSGTPRLIIDTDAEVYGLGVTESSVVVVNVEAVVTWNLPAGDCIPDLRVDITDSVRTAALDYDGHGTISEILSTITVSSDLHHIAVAGTHWSDHYVHKYSYIHLYDVPTGRHLVGVTADQEQALPTPWFTPDGREVWLGGRDQADGWKIVEGSKSNVTELEHLGTTKHRPVGSPWQSSRGYQVMDDQWVLSPGGKRLFWLPPQWRSDEWFRRWGRRFLALQHGEIPEAVILELE